MRAGTLGFVLIGALLSSGFAEAAKMSVIHRFAGGSDGCAPQGVSRSADGAVFGATNSDGAYVNNTIFEVLKNESGILTFNTIFRFVDKNKKYYGMDPSVPVADKNGVLYGAAAQGGLYDGGIIYSLMPPTTSSSKWVFKALHHFDPAKEAAYPGGNSMDSSGTKSSGALLIDSKGNIYGSTQGTSQIQDNYGEIFKLSKPTSTNGTWTKSSIHQFKVSNEVDGYGNVTGIIFDLSGNIFGTTEYGGSFTYTCGDGNDSRFGCGVLFRLKKPSISSGAWTYSVVNRFLQDYYDGANPVGSLVRSSTGTIYGVTNRSGSDLLNFDAGSIYKVDSPASAAPVYRHVANLRPDGGLGYLPRGGLAQDSAGNLYGTASYGGAYGNGTLFKLVKTLNSNNIIVWKKQRLYSFKNVPVGNIAVGDSGEIYGVTRRGGTVSYCGAIYRWTP